MANGSGVAQFFRLIVSIRVDSSHYKFVSVKVHFKKENNSTSL